jgi:hypothetical protein
MLTVDPGPLASPLRRSFRRHAAANSMKRAIARICYPNVRPYATHNNSGCSITDRAFRDCASHPPLLNDMSLIATAGIHKAHFKHINPLTEANLVLPYLAGFPFGYLSTEQVTRLVLS